MPKVDTTDSPVETAPTQLALDGDGEVTPREVANVKLALESLTFLDGNGDGDLSVEEFEAGAEASLAGLVASLDRNGDGFLDVSEMTTIPLAARRSIDKDGGGKLSREQLHDWLRQGRKQQFLTLDRNKDNRIRIVSWARARIRDERTLKKKETRCTVLT